MARKASAAAEPDTAELDTSLVDAQAATSDALDEAIAKQDEERKQVAEEVTQAAADENRLPASTAVANPAPGTVMNSGGAFVEPEVLAVDTSHPSVEGNPRFGTSAIQNGADWNDPNRRTPTDPKFAGTGLDLSVYGDQGKE